MTDAEKKIARATVKDSCPCDTNADRVTPSKIGVAADTGCTISIDGSDCVVDATLPDKEQEFKVDMDQVKELYTFFNESIRASLQKDYDCKKINGTTFADLWSKMMPSIMQSSLSAVISIQTKETVLDRKLKELQFCEMQQESIRKDALTNVDISTKLLQGAVLTSDSRLKETQSNEIVVESSRKSDTSQADVNLKNAQVDLACQQKAKSKYETDSILPSQYDLTVRQTNGFDDNLRQKLFEAQMNAWAMMFSSGLLEEAPCFIVSDEATKLYNGIINKKMPRDAAERCTQPTATP